MTIQELIDAKEELEGAIDELIRAFDNLTGLIINDIQFAEKMKYQTKQGRMQPCIELTIKIERP